MLQLGLFECVVLVVRLQTPLSRSLYMSVLILQSKKHRYGSFQLPHSASIFLIIIAVGTLTHALLRASTAQTIDINIDTDIDIATDADARCHWIHRSSASV